MVCVSSRHVWHFCTGRYKCVFSLLRLLRLDCSFECCDLPECLSKDLGVRDIACLYVHTLPGMPGSWPSWQGHIMLLSQGASGWELAPVSLLQAACVISILKNAENVPISGCFSEHVKYLQKSPGLPFRFFVVCFRNSFER